MALCTPGRSHVTGTLPYHGRSHRTITQSGLWNDSQIAPLRRVIVFVHSQGQKIGIQLSHAGQKANTMAPWLSAGDVGDEHVNGWADNMYLSSAILYSDKHAISKEMTREDIKTFKNSVGCKPELA